MKKITALWFLLFVLFSIQGFAENTPQPSASPTQQAEEPEITTPKKSSAAADEILPLPEFRLGLGVDLGYPTGITAKYWIRPRQATTATFGMIIGTFSYLMFTLEYAFHFPSENVAVWRSIPFIRNFDPYFGPIFVYGKSQATGTDLICLGATFGGDWMVSERVGLFLEGSLGYGPGLLYNIFFLARGGFRYYF